MIISCGDLKLVGSARQCPTLAVCSSVGWCSKGNTRTPTLAGWCSRCCVDGVVFQKVVPEGWCSKSWGGAPNNCPRIPTARWGGVSKVGVFQKVVPEWGGVPKVGVVFQKVVPESLLCILLFIIHKFITFCDWLRLVQHRIDPYKCALIKILGRIFIHFNVSCTMNLRMDLSQKCYRNRVGVSMNSRYMT